MSNSFNPYPYPVLSGANGGLIGTFQLNPSELVKGEQIYLPITAVLEQESLQRLIDSGKAHVMVEVKCTQTYYRRSQVAKDMKAEFYIDWADVEGRMTAGLFIVAAQDIPSFIPHDADEFYRGQEYFIEKGDVLAEGGEIEFFAIRNFDPLKASLASFVNIRRKDKVYGPMDVDYKAPGGMIIVSLPSKAYDHYAVASKNPILQGVLNGMFILPVISNAVLGVLEGEGSDRYNHRLADILKDKDLSSEDPLEIAQMLLVDPEDRGFENLIALATNNDAYEEFDND